MALLFVHSIYYSCEVHFEDGRCLSHIFSGTPLKARESALTMLLEYVLGDETTKGAYCCVSVHNKKTAEKIPVTSSVLLRRPHQGLQRELDLYEQEGIQVDKVLFNYKHPQELTLLVPGANTNLLRKEHTLMGLAREWWVTFGRKKTRFNAAS